MNCVAVMMAITGLAILHKSRGGRNEKRDKQWKRAGERDLSVSSCLLFFTPIYLFLVQPEENLLVLQDKEGKGRREHECSEKQEGQN